MSLVQELTESGSFVGLSPEAIADVAQTAPAFLDDPVVERLAKLLNTAPVAEALAEVEKEQLEETRGKASARKLRLHLALRQVGPARARRSELTEELQQKTFADVSLWARTFHQQAGVFGLTAEVLGWLQRSLRGGLTRLGLLQFEPIPLANAMRVVRRPSGELSAVDLDQKQRIDLRTGDLSEPVDVLEEPGVLELERGMSVIDMHTPANARVTLAGVVKSVRSGFDYFASAKPIAVAGEAWLLDPQVAAMLPRNVGIHALQRVCHRYPSTIPEAKTIRRLFGPDVSRADLPGLSRDKLNSLQLQVVDLLADPKASLRARGGFFLLSELPALEASIEASL